MKEQIVHWIPAAHIMSAGKLPEEFEVCHNHAVANASGRSGVLVRHRHTGVYWLWSPTATVAINQRFAERVHGQNGKEANK